MHFRKTTSYEIFLSSCSSQTIPLGFFNDGFFLKVLHVMLCAIHLYGQKMVGIGPPPATRTFDQHGSFVYNTVHTTKDTTIIISTSVELDLK